MQQKPKWWLLFATFPLSVGLLWLDGRLTLQPQIHQLLEIGIILLSFGWMALWVRAHPAAPADESAAPITFLVLPNAKRDSGFDYSARIPDWHPVPDGAIDERAPVDLKGRYN